MERQSERGQVSKIEKSSSENDNLSNLSVKAKPYVKVQPCFQLGLEQQNEILKDAWLSKLIFGQELQNAIIAPVFEDADFENTYKKSKFGKPHGNNFQSTEDYQQEHIAELQAKVDSIVLEDQKRAYENMQNAYKQSQNQACNQKYIAARNTSSTQKPKLTISDPTLEAKESLLRNLIAEKTNLLSDDDHKQILEFIHKNKSTYKIYQFDESQQPTDNEIKNAASFVVVHKDDLSKVKFVVSKSDLVNF